MQLSEIIIQRIQTEGPISFREFMDMALYYPQLGYYTSGKTRIGSQGDYYTSPILSSLFGLMIGRQMEEMFHLLSERPFSIIEYGAGTGILCNDIIASLKHNSQLYDNLTYYIIEKEGRQKNNIALAFPEEKVKFIGDISEAPAFSGCIMSNELLDNFPVHRVVMKDELMEVFVEYGDGFQETLRPASEKLKHYFSEQEINLQKDYQAEVNMEAIDWICNIADNLQSGYVMTIDYGFPKDELYSVKRSAGTLACYYRHTVSDTFYENIGEQDITAHVNFSALHHWGKMSGLNIAGFCSQHYFLRSMGLANELRNLEASLANSDRTSFSEINKLLIDMGTRFKVLIQQKGIPEKGLRGMQFSGKLV